MNQIMRIGKGVVIAVEAKMRQEDFVRWREVWKSEFPDVPLIVVPEARIVERDEITVFEFTGSVTPTFVAEFNRWWKEVHGGHG